VAGCNSVLQTVCDRLTLVTPQRDKHLAALPRTP
jgi:hypothetical protein